MVARHNDAKITTHRHLAQFDTPYNVCIIMNMKRRDMYLAERQWQALKEQAEELEISISELVRRIIDHHLGAAK